MAGTPALDVAVVGAGLLGCAAAARLAAGGMSVAVFEAEEVGAGASGRNSGALEHPYDRAQGVLYERSLALLRELGIDLPHRPVGVMLVDRGADAVRQEARRAAREHPELEPRVLDPEQARRLEPGLAEGVWACRLETGHPIPPRLATGMYADLAVRHGAALHPRVPAALAWEGRACTGVRAGEREVPSRRVLVAAGAGSCRVVDPSGAWRPVVPSWGVNLEVGLRAPPRHMLIEVALARVQAGGGAPAVDHAFGLITAAGRSALGATFLPDEPDPAAWAARLLERGAGFVGALRRAPVLGHRACARPRCADGRPLLGTVAGAERLLVATGSGGRGISTGAASGHLVAEAILHGTDDGIPAALRASRHPLPGITAGAAG